MEGTITTLHSFWMGEMNIVLIFRACDGFISIALIEQFQNKISILMKFVLNFLSLSKKVLSSPFAESAPATVVVVFLTSQIHEKPPLLRWN